MSDNDTKFIPDLGGMMNDPRLASVFAVLRPYIPAIQREGQSLYNDVIKSAILGDWDQVNTVAWRYMTDDERDKASAELLKEAQDAVDSNYRREQLAREIAFKLIGALLTSLL
jgi:hypothetical protein